MIATFPVGEAILADASVGHKSALATKKGRTQRIRPV
jgi:hypothetical protein